MPGMEHIGGVKMDAELDLGRLLGDVKKLETLLLGLDPSLKRTEAGLAGVENAGKRATTSAGGLGLSIRNLVPQLTAAHLAAVGVQKALVGIQNSFTAPIANARSFETAMARVSTVMKGSTSESVKALGKEILDLSKVIPKTKEELGAGLYQIMQSGIENASDAMQILKVSAEAAVGGVTEIDTAAKVLTDTINAYGLEAEDAAQLADIMFVGAREGTAEFEDLAAAMGTVNSSAALLGVSVNEVVAAVEAMSLAGIDAQTATTSLNRLLLSVVDPSKEVKDAVKEIQKSFKDFEFSADALKAKGLQGFMKELQTVVGDNQELMVKLTGDVRAFRAASVIAGTGAENFARILDETKESEGALREAFIKNADTVDNLLVVAWNGFVATITEAANEHLPELKEQIAGLMAMLEQNKDKIFETASAFTDALIGAFNLVIDKAPAVISALQGIASAASAVIDGISFATQGTNHPEVDSSAMLLYNRLKDQGAPIDEQLWKTMAGKGLSGDAMANVQRMSEQGVNWNAQDSWMRRSSGRSPLLMPTVTPHGAGAGGGVGSGSAGDTAKELAKAEKDMLAALKEEASVNLDNLKLRREELQLKEKLGTLTKAERVELDRINNRLEFQGDKIKDATKAWEEQVEMIEKAEQRVQSLNEEIAEDRKKLADSLKEIDEEGKQQKTGKLEELIREQRTLDEKFRLGEGSLADEMRRKQIDDQLDTFRQTPEGTSLLKDADELAGLDDFQKIDRETTQKRRDAQDKSDARLAELQSELDAEQKKLAALKEAEEEKKRVVIEALEQRAVVTDANYVAVEARTKAHADAMVKEFNRIRDAALDAARAENGAGVAGAGNDQPTQKYAAGGAVHGPGTATSDSVFARLSAGEHVLTAADVSAMGGQAAVYAMRQALHREIPRFAQGGAVTTNDDHSKTVHLTQHYHDTGARVMSNPALMRWHLRRAL